MVANNAKTVRVRRKLRIGDLYKLGVVLSENTLTLVTIATVIMEIRHVT